MYSEWATMISQIGMAIDRMAVAARHTSVSGTRTTYRTSAATAEDRGQDRHLLAGAPRRQQSQYSYAADRHAQVHQGEGDQEESQPGRLKGLSDLINRRCAVADAILQHLDGGEVEPLCC